MENQNEQNTKQKTNGGVVDVAKGFFWNKIKIYVLGCAGIALLAFLVGCLIFSIIYNVIGTFAPIFMGDNNESSEISNDDLSEEEAKFKKKVDEVAEKMETDYSYSIDKGLLIATVFTVRNTDGIYNKEENPDYENIDEEDIEDSLEEGTEETEEEEEIDTEKYKVSKRELLNLAKKMKDGEDAYREYLISDYIPDSMDGLNEDQIERVADDIFSLADMYNELFYGKEKGDTSNGCDPFANLMVHIKTPSLDKSMTFREYIIGVVWPESSYWSANSESYSVEYGKAQTMASKSYALAGVNYQKGMTDVTITNTTEGFQVWCDIYTQGACGSTGNPSEQQITNLNQRYDDVADLVRVDDNGKILTTYFASNQEVCNRSETHKGCKEDASTNAMNQAGAYEKAQNGMTYEQILDVYYQGHNESFAEGAVCASSGAYATWKQTDPRWGDITIKGGSTIRQIGCLATSVSILIAKSGVETTVDGEFNPGTFVQKLNATGGFTNGNFRYGFAEKAAPDFKYEGSQEICGTSKEEKIKIIKGLLDKGYYITMEVKGARTCGASTGQHWVAIDSVTDDKIYMMDPASNSTDLFATYGNKGNQIHYYKVVKG